MFYRLNREVLFHAGSTLETNHGLVNSLLPMRPVIGAAGSQHSGDHGADLIEPIWWGDDGEDDVGASVKCRNCQMDRNRSRVMRPATGS